MKYPLSHTTVGVCREYHDGTALFLEELHSGDAWIIQLKHEDAPMITWSDFLKLYPNPYTSTGTIKYRTK